MPWEVSVDRRKNASDEATPNIGRPSTTGDTPGLAKDINGVPASTNTVHASRG